MRLPVPNSLAKTPMRMTMKRRSSKPRIRPIDELLRKEAPLFKAFYVEEPKLVFANNGLSVDPKAGLEDYGPFGNVPGKIVRLGIIGTGQGIQAFRDFLRRAQGRLSAGFNQRNKPLDPHTYPDFPGCAQDHTFRAQFAADQSSHQRVIPLELFKQALRAPKSQDKIQRVVDLTVKQVEAMAALEDTPDVIVLVMPPEVEAECASIGVPLARQKIRLTPLQRLQRKFAKEAADTGQSFLELQFDDPDRDARPTAFFNIHHALKAHAMKTGRPTQLAWESTFAQSNPASIGWNLFTALYYKAGNSPWRLQSLPEQTCFVGVSFFKENPTAAADMQTSLAQVFGAGEGIVLRGEKAVMDIKRDRKAHLSEEGAQKLLERAIEQYKLQHSLAPKRVVIHKTSRYWPEEMRGFKKALGEIYHYDFLALETRDVRFMRIGRRPPLRGTVVQLGEGNYLLFGNGYIPYLRAYPGKRIPRPLEIIEHHGVSPAETVCQELLALTKLNWNSCSFGSSVPITIRFARDVGKILTELPKGIQPETKYKFYM
jgi:hypothetical protein